MYNGREEWGMANMLYASYSEIIVVKRTAEF